jgi:dihydroorotate dehydrogenase
VSYERLLRTVLLRLEPATAHRLAVRGATLATRPPAVRAALPRLLATERAALRTEALGLSFPNPLGVAAGMDKDATWSGALGALGFGHVEIGTVTPLPQAGNPEPTLARLPADRALVNRQGFPSAGAAAVVERLRDRAPGGPLVAANVGKLRATRTEDAPADYAAAAAALAPYADWLVVNVSSPNTLGLRELQAADHLREIVAAVRGAGGPPRPLLVKIAPDLSDGEVEAVAGLALELGLDGVVATNTTLARTGLSAPGPWDGEALPGGVSGAPLRARSLAVLRRLRAVTGDRLVLVSSGGIADAGDAWERLVAGATLLQAYTGFVYGGPLFAHRICRGLTARLAASGASSLREIVGSGAGAGSRGAAA